MPTNLDQPIASVFDAFEVRASLAEGALSDALEAITGLLNTTAGQTADIAALQASDTATAGALQAIMDAQTGILGRLTALENAPAPTPPLNALLLSSTSFTTGGVTSVGITGKTAGSTIVAISSDDTPLTVAGSTLSGTFATAGTPVVLLTETPADGGYPRVTAVGVTVANLNYDPPVPTQDMLPALTTSGASYHQIYSTERLRSAYTGPLAYINTGEGPAGGSDIGAGSSGLTASMLPATSTPIYGWYDQSGASDRNIIQDTLAKRPTLRGDAVIGTRLCAAFGGARLGTPQISVATAETLDLSTTSRTEILVIDPSTSAVNAVYSEHRLLAQAGETTGQVVRNLYDSASDNGSWRTSPATFSARVYSNPQVVVMVERESGTTLFVDGEKYTGAAPLGGGAGIRSVMLGAQASSNDFNANFKLAAYVSVNAPINDADAAAITGAMQRRFAIDAAYTVNLVEIGDSRDEGIRATETRNRKHFILPDVNAATRWYNIGVNGKTMAQCYADRASYEGALFVAGKKNIALLSAGINDLGINGTSGADLYAIATTYVGYLKGLGYKVGLATILPHTSANYDSFGHSVATVEQERVAYNALVRTNNAGADRIIDTANVSPIGVYPTGPNDPTLYADNIHLTSLGVSYEAPAYVAAINQMVNL